ncbi:N-methyl-L-tryptophan oxidase [Curtobacterium sp. MCBD17_003]|uniref:N-methyl-L-tryptophan oxidase n=1 Tax=Curtobacterium sp. MCBD17_003 TaxID=2175667 RepID=UPI000DAA4A93|nr:N-methyl-L-tryptophan oxidase [Curtobacterium sp. MCBD17_003]WIE54170.1 N-methyl-L-tryptophan oxidase [Curtobacterium sp. MCBD17_003]
MDVGHPSTGRSRGATGGSGATDAEVRVPGTVVVGLGGIGSAAAYHLAARGATVLGLDPRLPGHRDGSSHGRSRLVRQAYAEGPEYVALTTAAWRLWHELEQASGTRLLTESGVLAVAPRGEALVADTLAAARAHGLPVEHLTATAIRDRFPAFRVADGWEGVLEREAGFVDPEATVRAHHRLAQEHGAEFRAERVVDIAFGAHPLVRTDVAAYRADRVVVAAGPWAPELLAATGLRIVARRKVVAHFAPTDPRGLGADAMPGFSIQHDGHLYYGFPDHDGQGVKIGRHDGGEDTTPDTIDRVVRPDEVAELRGVLERFLPGAAGADLDAYSCMYTMSSDEDFILGALPGAPACFVATGCSGHAFKFVPVLGEVLADLALGVRPRYDIGFLSLDRAAARASAAIDR